MGPNMASVFIRRDQGCVHTEKRPCEDTVRRWPSPSQGERSQEKPNLSVLDLGLVGFRTVKK